MTEPVRNIHELPYEIRRDMRKTMGSVIVFLTLLFLGGFLGYTFAANIFVGLTIILFVLLSIVILIIPSQEFAEKYILDHFTFIPLGIGLICLGFSWYVTWILWWTMFAAVVGKKIVGDEEIKQGGSIHRVSPDSEDDETPPRARL